MSLDVHSHCTSCFELSCSDSEGCPMVACDQGCDALFHWCKKPEHALLCDKQTVPCINQAYGCPMEMMRCEIRDHMNTCPANVVFCTNGMRRPIYPGKQTMPTRHNFYMQGGQLQAALAMDDQPMTSPPTYPAESIESNTNQLSAKGSSPVDSGCSETSNEANTKESGSSEECSPPPPSDSSLSLFDLLRHYPNKGNMDSSMCGGVLRRDQYRWHVKNVHAEILAGLDGWIQQRCPLSEYGCDYSITRLSPNNKDSMVVYSPVMKTMGMQHCDNTLTKIKKPDNGGPDLVELPFEVLENILDYLDGFSLNNLALTCSTLQKVCSSMLQKKGVVLTRWEKGHSDEKPLWIKTNKLWLFPNAVNPIEKWVTQDLFSMTEHLQHCSYNNKRNIKTDPSRVIFSYQEDTQKTPIPTGLYA